MRFKLDENLPGELAVDLAEQGHEADTVVDEGLRGTSDPEVMARAEAEGRVLMTLDKGIGNLRDYPPRQRSGIVLFRPGATGRRAVLEFVRRRLPELLSLELDGRLVVVTERGLRSR